MKIGLALGSGGARGLAHIKFLEVFDKLNIKPSIIAGSSVGALIGAMYCSGLSSKEIKKIFSKISIKEFTKIVGHSLKNKEKTHSDLILDYFKEFIKEKNIEDLKIPLKIVVSDIYTGKEVVLTKGPLIIAIKASMAYPILIKPVEIKNHHFIDGGTINPLPYNLLENVDLKIAIDLTKFPKKTESKRISFYENIFRPIWIMQKTIVENKLKNSKPDIYIKPNLNSIKLLDFHKLNQILKQVKPDAQKLEDELIKKLNKENNK